MTDENKVAVRYVGGPTQGHNEKVGLVTAGEVYQVTPEIAEELLGNPAAGFEAVEGESNNV